MSQVVAMSHCMAKRSFCKAISVSRHRHSREMHRREVPPSLLQLLPPPSPPGKMGVTRRIITRCGCRKNRFERPGILVLDRTPTRNSSAVAPFSAPGSCAKLCLRLAASATVLAKSCIIDEDMTTGTPWSRFYGACLTRGKHRQLKTVCRSCNRLRLAYPLDASLSL